MEIDIKYCCNTVHAVYFRRELVLENATSGSLEVLEFHYQNIVGTLVESFFRLVLVIAQRFAETKLWTRQSLRPKLIGTSRITS